MVKAAAEQMNITEDYLNGYMKGKADEKADAEEMIVELQEDRPEDAEDLKAAMKAGANAVWRECAGKIIVKVGNKSVEIKRSADKIRFKTSWFCKSEVEF